MTVKEIASLLAGEVVGDASCEINGAEQISKAGAAQITFIGSRHYAKLWASTAASAAIVNHKLAEGLEVPLGKALIKVQHADLAMAQLLEALEPEPPGFEEDVHPSAIIDPSAQIGQGVKIGAGCFVGKNVRLGEGVKLYPNVVIFDDTEIGPATTIWSGTVIRERCKLGAQCIIHANVSIGADGFGFRPAPDGRGVVKVPQIGTVEIGNAVEIGANSCVDRGKFSATVIGDGTKIDNLVQIAHNVTLGRVCLIAANVGIAGSSSLGDGVMVGGGASIKDHVDIGSGAVIAACAGVIGDVPAGQRVLGAPAREYRTQLRAWARLREIAAGE